MAELPAGPDGGAGDEIAGTPLWVRIFGIIALIVFLLVIAVLLIGGGIHGPARHAP